MNHQIITKLAAVAFAVLMNGVVLGSVAYLFAPPATAMSQPIGERDARIDTRGVV